MSRIMSQALIARSTLKSSLLTTLSLKHRHTLAEGTLIEIDLVESSSESGDSNGAVRIIKIEDLMHTIIAQRSAPSWLPFIPGSSYWVPPKLSSAKVANLMRKSSALLYEEALSVTTFRGWPSSHHLLKGDGPSDVKVKLEDSNPDDTEIRVKVGNTKSKSSNNEED